MQKDINNLQKSRKKTKKEISFFQRKGRRERASLSEGMKVLEEME